MRRILHFIALIAAFVASCIVQTTVYFGHNNTAFARGSSTGGDASGGQGKGGGGSSTGGGSSGASSSSSSTGASIDVINMRRNFDRELNQAGGQRDFFIDKDYKMGRDINPGSGSSGWREEDVGEDLAKIRDAAEDLIKSNPNALDPLVANTYAIRENGKSTADKHYVPIKMDSKDATGITQISKTAKGNVITIEEGLE